MSLQEILNVHQETGYFTAKEYLEWEKMSKDKSQKKKKGHWVQFYE